jgi:hypothetical protein
MIFSQPSRRVEIVPSLSKIAWVMRIPVPGAEMTSI